MPEKTLFKVKNVSGGPRTVDIGTGPRRVEDDGVIEVTEDQVYGLTCQESNWAPAGTPAKKVHDEAHAAQLEANKPPQPEADDESQAEESPAAEKEN